MLPPLQLVHTYRSFASTISSYTAFVGLPHAGHSLDWIEHWHLISPAMASLNTSKRFRMYQQF
ncbi:hypothetical protein XH97_13355 [Bradyrhizobium sp. CCBAU 53380]|nr:hypothetical protein [Bradyrhizobium sp. CCBAU 53380]